MTQVKEREVGGEEKRQKGCRGSPRWERTIIGFSVLRFMPARPQGRKETGQEGGRGEGGGTEDGLSLGLTRHPSLVSFLMAFGFHSSIYPVLKAVTIPPLPSGEAAPTSGSRMLLHHPRAEESGGKFWSPVTWAKIPAFPLTKLCNLDRVTQPLWASFLICETWIVITPSL